MDVEEKMVAMLHADTELISLFGGSIAATQIGADTVFQQLDPAVKVFPYIVYNLLNQKLGGFLDCPLGGMNTWWYGLSVFATGDATISGHTQAKLIMDRIVKLFVTTQETPGWQPADVKLRLSRWDKDENAFRQHTDFLINENLR